MNRFHKLNERRNRSAPPQEDNMRDISTPKAMGALRAFLEAFRLLHANLKPLVSILLLVLVPCDLLSSLAQHYVPPLLVLDGNSLLHDETVAIPPNKVEVAPVSIIISSLLDVVMVYLSIIACSGNKPSLDELFWRAGKTWRRPAITVLFARLFQLLLPLVTMAIATNKVEVQLVSSIISGILVVVIVCLSIMAGSGYEPSCDASSQRAGKTWWRPAITVLYSGLIWLLPPLAPVVLPKIPSPSAGIGYVSGWILLLMSVMLVLGVITHVAVSSLLESWGLVASVQEEGSYGIKAFGRAWGFMKERKVQVLVLTLAMLPLETGISKLFSFEKVDTLGEMTLAILVTKSLVRALVWNLWRIYYWLLHATLYYHQKNY